MFICLKNALMPSENQQVLRLRLAYLMRRFLLLALGMGLLLPTAISADETFKNWDDINWWKKDLSKTHKIPISVITDLNVDDARIGSCEVLIIYKKIPNDQIKKSCISLYKKYQGKLDSMGNPQKFLKSYVDYVNKNSKDEKETNNDIHEKCLRASDYQGCMKYNQPI